MRRSSLRRPGRSRLVGIRRDCCSEARSGPLCGNGLLQVLLVVHIPCSIGMVAWVRPGKGIEVVGKQPTGRAGGGNEMALWIFLSCPGADRAFRIGQTGVARADDTLWVIHQGVGRGYRLSSRRWTNRCDGRTARSLVRKSYPSVSGPCCCG